MRYDRDTSPNKFPPLFDAFPGQLWTITPANTLNAYSSDFYLVPQAKLQQKDNFILHRLTLGSMGPVPSPSFLLPLSAYILATWTTCPLSACKCVTIIWNAPVLGVCSCHPDFSSLLIYHCIKNPSLTSLYKIETFFPSFFPLCFIFYSSFHLAWHVFMSPSEYFLFFLCKLLYLWSQY